MYKERYGSKYKSKIRICQECKTEFIPASNGDKNYFCSNSCSTKHQWKTRPRVTRKIVYRTCESCGNQYEKDKKFSFNQWSINKFCSLKCAAEKRKIKDGMTTHERTRRKNGRLKMGTPEWLERIRATTKEGMYKPDVQEKIRKPKGAMSEERKMIISNALVGKMPVNMAFGGSGNFPNIQRGNYECSKGDHYFRSKWEANYALYLDFLVKQGEISNWEYEPETFFFEQIKLGTRSYRPDFKVFNNDESVEYHEVKGYMDAKSKTKLKRMEKYFPDIKLILIEGAFYRELLKKMKGIIKFY